MRVIALMLLMGLMACKPLTYIHSEGFRPQNMSPEFELGWKHGCPSGMATEYGNTLYKLGYKFYQDPRMTGNRQYLEGWRYGYHYCRHYTAKTTADGWLGKGYSESLRDPRISKEKYGIVPDFFNGGNLTNNDAGLMGISGQGDALLYGPNPDLTGADRDGIADLLGNPGSGGWPQ